MTVVWENSLEGVEDDGAVERSFACNGCAEMLVTSAHVPGASLAEAGWLLLSMPDWTTLHFCSVDCLRKVVV